MFPTKSHVLSHVGLSPGPGDFDILSLDSTTSAPGISSSMIFLTFSSWWPVVSSGEKTPETTMSLRPLPRIAAHSSRICFSFSGVISRPSTNHRK